MNDKLVEPRGKRASVMLSARITLPNGTTTEHRVKNLSETGVCIHHADPIEAGVRLTAAIGLLDGIGAVVAWAERGLAGIEFDGMIDTEAARRARSSPSAVKSGWMTNIENAYHRPERRRSRT